jgi:hypothetical protein
MAWNRYVTPFSYRLWLAAAIAGCVLGVCLAVNNFSKKSNQRLSLFDTVFYIPSCICQQGQKANSLYGFFILPIMLSPVFLSSPFILLGIFFNFKK